MMVIYSWSRAPRRWPSASKNFYLSKGGTSPAISLPSNDANATFKRNRPLSWTSRAAPCGGDFNGFLAAMARDARGQGISRSVIDTAFAGVTPDPAVLAFDRRQHGTFRQSFERYAATRVTAPRIKRAKIRPGRRPAGEPVSSDGIKVRDPKVAAYWHAHLSY
jgi:membrane-bound lytic murein transglycosylase B